MQELPIKLLVTGEKVNKETELGARLEYTISAEELDLIKQVSEKLGFSLEECVYYFMEENILNAVIHKMEETHPVTTLEKVYEVRQRRSKFRIFLEICKIGPVEPIEPNDETKGV